MAEFVLALLVALRVFFRTRRDTALEILALRHQVAVLKRKRPRPPLNSVDRLFWATLRRMWSRWADVLVIVKPETVVGWHRTGFRLYWRWRSRPRGGHIVKNVSAGGAFIFANFKWPPGTIVTMTLQLEEEPVRGHRPPVPVLVQTKVVRCVPDGLGVQFLDLSKMERQRLMDFLKSIPESQPSR